MNDESGQNLVTVRITHRLIQVHCQGHFSFFAFIETFQTTHLSHLYYNAAESSLFLTLMGHLKDKTHIKLTFSQVTTILL